MDSPSLNPASPSSPSLRRMDDGGSPSLLPEALQQSPVAPAAAATGASGDVPNIPDLQLPAATSRQVEPAPVPEGPASTAAESGVRNLLSDVSGINADEEYSRDERLLNEFTKLHPMLSLYV